MNTRINNLHRATQSLSGKKVSDDAVIKFKTTSSGTHQVLRKLGTFGELKRKVVQLKENVKDFSKGRKEFSSYEGKALEKFAIKALGKESGQEFINNNKSIFKGSVTFGDLKAFEEKLKEAQQNKTEGQSTNKENTLLQGFINQKKAQLSSVTADIKEELKQYDTQKQNLVLSIGRTFLNEKYEDILDAKPIQNWIKNEWAPKGKTGHCTLQELQDINSALKNITEAYSHLPSIQSAIADTPNSSQAAQSLVQKDVVGDLNTYLLDVQAYAAQKDIPVLGKWAEESREFLRGAHNIDPQKLQFAQNFISQAAPLIKTMEQAFSVFNKPLSAQDAQRQKIEGEPFTLFMQEALSFSSNISKNLGQKLATFINNNPSSIGLQGYEDFLNSLPKA